MTLEHHKLSVDVCAEQTRDARAVHAVHVAAFDTDAEARLVDQLREQGAMVLSLVAINAGEIVGHVALSTVTTPDAKHEHRGLGLAPIGVLPVFQRRGVGARLINAAIERALTEGFEFLVVLGDPNYYSRFGFVRASGFALRCVYPAAEEAFQLLELRPGALRDVRGLVRYPRAFEVFE